MQGPTASVDEVDLVAALRAGRPEAARMLFAAYAPALVAFAHRRTGDPELAQEIMQDVMVKAWRAGPTFDEARGSLRSWIFQIARNEVVDALRRRGRRPPAAGRFEAADELVSQVDQIEEHLTTWVVEAALDKLAPDHRDVVDLVYFQQLRVKDAAAVLGVPEGTVKSRCYYALSNLRSAFAELGVARDDV